MRSKTLFIALLMINLLFGNISYIKAESLDCAFGIEKGSSAALKSGDIISIDLGFDGISANQQIKQATYSLTFSNNDFEIVYQNGSPIKTYYDWNIDDYYTDGTGYAVRSVIFTISTTKDFVGTNKNLGLKVANIKLRAKHNLLRKESIIRINDNKTDFYLDDDDYSTQCSNTQKLIVNLENVSTYEPLYLENIIVNDGALDIYNTKGEKGYDKKYKDYTILVDEDTESIELEAVCNTNNCKINGNGNLKLNKKYNYFQLSIENNGIYEYYYLNVIKVSKCNDNTFECYTNQLITFQNYTCPTCNDDYNLLNKYYEIKDNQQQCSEKIKYIEVCNNKKTDSNETVSKCDNKSKKNIFEILILFCAILFITNIIQFIINKKIRKKIK